MRWMTTNCARSAWRTRWTVSCWSVDTCALVLAVANLWTNAQFAGEIWLPPFLRFENNHTRLLMLTFLFRQYVVRVVKIFKAWSYPEVIHTLLVMQLNVGDFHTLFAKQLAAEINVRLLGLEDFFIKCWVNGLPFNTTYQWDRHVLN